MKLVLLCLILPVTVLSTNPELPVLSWQPDTLLMASDDISSFYEFDVSNKRSDVTERRELPHGYNLSKAITYDSSTKTLFWSGCTRNPDTEERETHILSTVNNSGIVNTVHTSTSSYLIYGLAVDSGRQLLFLSTGWDKNTVEVMDTRGNNYRVLSHVHDDCHMSPFHLALDTNRQLIYVACYYRLLRMTYEGHQESVLQPGSRIWNVAFDQPTGTLFYNDNKYVYTLNPLNVNTALYIQLYLQDAPNCVISHGSYLFISYMERNVVHVVDVHDGRIISTIRDIPGDFYHWWSLAYIPPQGQ